MTDPELIERITRSLAFMLRHQPETFDLELDSHGFSDLGDVVHALNERLGEEVDEEDVRTAVRSGDRPRYEIQGDRIRALYGHSIPVEPGPSSKPPEVLYVAVPEQELERARRFGLRGGRRRFLHLAITKEDAAESGRRASRDYAILVIHALDAWEEGISFYDRTALWLAEEVPTHLLEIEGTYHDGTDPIPRRFDGGRESGYERAGHGQGHGRGRRRGRGGRGRGRQHEPSEHREPRGGRERYGEGPEPSAREPERYAVPVHEDRDLRPPPVREPERSREPYAAPPYAERGEPRREGRPEDRRPERRPERHGGRDSREERRPERAGGGRPERGEPPRRERPEPSTTRPGAPSSFGAGLDSQEAREAPREPPRQAPSAPAPRPSAAPREERPAPDSDTPRFGAGL